MVLQPILLSVTCKNYLLREFSENPEKSRRLLKEKYMRNLLIIVSIFVISYANLSSQIVDVTENGSTLIVKTESGSSGLLNIVNSSCKLSGFNTKYIVVSCSESQINIYKEDGSSVTNISNAIYPDNSVEPKYVSNVTENYIIVKSRNSKRKDFYDFNGKYVRCEEC